MNFSGWVPTVTGHLSFSSIGNATHPTKSSCIRLGNELCFMQQRDLLDVVLPFVDNTNVGRFVRETFSNHIIGITGRFTFLALCDIAPSGEYMSGSVFLIPEKDNSEIIKVIKKQFLCNEREYSEFQAAITNIKACQESAKSCASVKLFRNGKFYLQLENVRSAEEQNVVEKLVANQFFYFFKDVSHVHQHHDPKQDAITQLSPVLGESDESWIHETQHSLYREVIRFKRFRSEGALFRASGVLAYAQSFERSHVSGSKVSCEFNNQELEKSLSISRDELKHRDQKRIAFIETTRNWFFSLFGVVISATFLVRLAPSETTPQVNSLYYRFTEIVAQKPIPVVAIVVFFAWISSFVTHQNDPARFNIVRTMLRWFQGFHIRWFFISNLILTVVFAAMFYFFLIKLFL